MSEQMMSKAVKALERIGMVLGGLYVNQHADDDQGAKALRLRRCGFGNTEIAELLGTTANTINVALHSQKKKAGAKGSARKGYKKDGAKKPARRMPRR